uniref:type I protein arginine methyltransferase n=1 Tax=Daucus carota subsp. sativus TaxID=79200 RepID=A0A161ZJM3_DAUCS
MEVARNPIEQEFTIASLSHLPSSSSSSSPALSPIIQFFSDSGVSELRFEQGSEPLNFNLCVSQVFKLGPTESICVCQGSETDKEKIYSRGLINIQFRNEEESRNFHFAFKEFKKEFITQGLNLPNGAQLDSKSSYYAAVIENRVDFAGQVVVDVGAGSGILSLFAAQAGEKHVYAVEASEMADYARKLIAENPLLSQKIKLVVKGKVEDVECPEKADILISEPMGKLSNRMVCLTLLINERMLESYVIARDRFLFSNGKMFPTLGRIHMAPFSDEYVYIEIANKPLFWQQQNYYGIDLTALHGTAFHGYFSQEEDLYKINVPLKFTSTVGTRIHRLACWFDVLFDGSTVQRWLTTAPGAPTTHWYQLRCVLSQPFFVMPGQEVVGHLHMIAYSAQSYTINLTMSAKMWGPGAEQGGILQTSSFKFDLKKSYYRMSQMQAYSIA